MPTACLGVLLVVSGSAQERVIRVGTVLDGPTDPDARAVSPEKQLVGDWSAAKARENVDTLLTDSEVDAVLVSCPSNSLQKKVSKNVAVAVILIESQRAKIAPTV